MSLIATPDAKIARFLDGRTALFMVESGSALYGTQTPRSDSDFRGVFLPGAREILTGHVSFGLDSNTENQRLGAGDIDISATSLMRFLTLLGRMDTISIEILFASRADRFLRTARHPVADMIWENRDRLIAGSADSAIGHARQRLGHLLPDTDRSMEVFQAARDLVAGAGVERLSDSESLLDALDALDHVRVFLRHNDRDLNETPWSQMDRAARARNRHNRATLFVQVLNKQITANSPAADALAVLDRPLDRIEAKRRASKRGAQVAFKDAYQAIRILSQAVEFYRTRHLSFPRPEADLLVAIRTGEVSQEDIGALASRLLEEIQDLQIRAPFQDKPCAETQKAILCDAHREVVLGGA